MLKDINHDVLTAQPWKILAAKDMRGGGDPRDGQAYSGGVGLAPHTAIVLSQDP